MGVARPFLGFFRVGAPVGIGGAMEAAGQWRTRIGVADITSCALDNFRECGAANVGPPKIASQPVIDVALPVFIGELHVVAAFYGRAIGVGFQRLQGVAFVVQVGSQPGSVGFPALVEFPLKRRKVRHRAPDLLDPLPVEEVLRQRLSPQELVVAGPHGGRRSHKDKEHGQYY